MQNCCLARSSSLLLTKSRALLNTDQLITEALQEIIRSVINDVSFGVHERWPLLMQSHFSDAWKMAAFCCFIEHCLAIHRNNRISHS